MAIQYKWFHIRIPVEVRDIEDDSKHDDFIVIRVLSVDKVTAVAKIDEALAELVNTPKVAS